MMVKYREWFRRKMAGTEEVEEERVTRVGRMSMVEVTETETEVERSSKTDVSI
jgi:hypothetical protein